MESNEKTEKQRLQEERLKRLQDSMREHRRKLATDEEYRKRSEKNQEFVKKLMIFGDDTDS